MPARLSRRRIPRAPPRKSLGRPRADCGAPEAGGVRSGDNQDRSASAGRQYILQDVHERREFELYERHRERRIGQGVQGSALSDHRAGLDRHRALRHCREDSRRSRGGSSGVDASSAAGGPVQAGAAPRDQGSADVRAGGREERAEIQDLRVGAGIFSRSNGAHWHVEAKVSIHRFAEFLSEEAARPVADQTGLSGSYTLTLDWAPADAAAANDPAAGPSLFTALQEQLGLKLDSTKGPVEMLVIDRAERTPSEN